MKLVHLVTHVAFVIVVIYFSVFLCCSTLKVVKMQTLKSYLPARRELEKGHLVKSTKGKKSTMLAVSEWFSLCIFGWGFIKAHFVVCSIEYAWLTDPIFQTCQLQWSMLLPGQDKGATVKSCTRILIDTQAVQAYRLEDTGFVVVPVCEICV